MVEETGSSMFGCFPAVLVALMIGVFAFLGVRQSAAVTAAAAPIDPNPQQAEAGMPNGAQSLTVIEKIETSVSSTVPATVTMQISGYQPDGCKFPVKVEQTRTGDKVTVKIYRSKPIGVMCTMDLNPYNDTITLDGTFDSGSYTVDVNGTVVIVKV